MDIIHRENVNDRLLSPGTVSSMRDVLSPSKRQQSESIFSSADEGSEAKILLSGSLGYVS